MNSWISRYFTSNFYNYPGRLSDLLYSGKVQLSNLLFSGKVQLSDLLYSGKVHFQTYCMLEKYLVIIHFWNHKND